MYGSKKDIKHNLTLFFVDGITFTPSLTLISVAAIVPYFLTRLDATTFQIALAASLALVCNFTAQPFFGSLASRSRQMNKTFGKVLLLQRSIFMIFVISMPVFSANNTLLIWMFLFFWGLFHIFVGSYGVFFTPLLLKLLPPDKRGTVRGIGFAIGSLLGLGSAALIPVVLRNISFPYNFMLIFSLGIFFLLVNAVLFMYMRQPKEITPNISMSVRQYFKGMPATIIENAPFRAMILTTMFLVVANSLLPFYTLYALRVFSATESHIAAFAALAVLSVAFAHVVFGAVVDRQGPKITLLIATLLVISAGVLALTTNSLSFLFLVWVLANLGNTCYLLTASLIIGEVSPSTKLPLYVGVQNIISLALSSLVLLLLAPLIENIGFVLLFAAVLACGLLSLLINMFVLRKAMSNQATAA